MNFRAPTAEEQDIPGLGNDGASILKVENQLAKPEEFLAWLENQDDMRALGNKCDRANCPVANYLKYHLPEFNCEVATHYTVIYSATLKHKGGQRKHMGEVHHRDWLIRFNKQIMEIGYDWVYISEALSVYHMIMDPSKTYHH